MDWCVVFCYVVCIVAWAWAPEVAELLLRGIASQPVQFHVHQLEALTGNVVGDDSKGRGVASLHGCRELLMPHFFKRVSCWDGFPTVDEKCA